MNTSPRRAPVIAWAITATALYGGAGLGLSPAAGADGGAAATDAAGAADAGGAAGASNASPPRRHGRDGAAVPDDNDGGGATHPDDRPCPWWPPVPTPMPFVPGPTTRSGGQIIPPVLVPTVPVPVFGDRATPAASADPLPEVRLDDFVSAPVPAAAAPATAARPAAIPAAAARPARTAPRVLSTPAAPAPPPAAPAAVSVPSAPAPPPRRPGAGTEPPAPDRLGYPEALRHADVATLLSMALPGLAAMAGMTAFGGVLGYRQARAGYLLRAAGAGRFLR